MKTRINLLIVLTLIASMLGAASPVPAAAGNPAVYVEPGLYSSEPTRFR